MNNKEHFDFLVDNGFADKEQDVKRVDHLVTQLIWALYVPVLTTSMSVVDQARLERFEIAGEPINWGSLRCVDVLRTERGYQVTIDEASPGECPTFCAYIEKYMQAWGWEVTVITEW